MTDKRIKSYLEDRLKRLESIRNKRKWTTAELGDAICCKRTLEFINSLQEEPVSEDLEEAAKEYANSLSSKCDKTYVAIDFKAGAEWQKEQMTANAADMVVGYWMPNGLMLTVDETENCYNIDEGDRVKLIVIKEN